MTNLDVTIDKEYPLSFEGFLFNEPELVKSHSWESHLFNLTDHQKAYARLVLYFNKEEAKSPYRAPFGSVEFDPALTYDQVDLLIRNADSYCRSRGVKQSTVVSYPFCYASLNSQLITTALVNNGYRIAISDLNFHMDCSKSSYEEALHASEKRRLKKCIQQNFIVRHEPHPDIEEMHELIWKNREEKGFPLSMKAAELKAVFEKYPERYYAFTMRDHRKLIACAIGVKVSSEILYYFLPATDVCYRHYSPIVMVVKEMFDFCRARKFSILDLGIATAEGVANPGLIRFKQHLGAIPSLKLTFEKKY